MPKLSIIIPTLNEEDYLPRLLESIKNQSFSDYELIVADAGSKDKTLEIARSFGCKITSGGLPGKARNSGAKIAQGEILLFLDADGILPSDFLKKAIKDFQEQKLGIAGFGTHVFDGRKIDKFVFYLFRKWMSLTGKVFPYSASAIMASKEKHNQVSGFDEDVKILEDMHYAMRIAKISKYRYLGYPHFVSARRYEKDGRITYLKYLLAMLQLVFFGPIKSDKFHYKFNHYKESKK